MTKKRNYYTASKKSKIALAAIEGKLTQAQLTSEYGVQVLSQKRHGTSKLFYFQPGSSIS